MSTLPVTVDAASHQPTLTELMRTAGVSKRKAQRIVGIAPASVRRIERGDTNRPSWHLCSCLAVLLRRETDEVLAACLESIRQARARQHGHSP